MGVGLDELLEGFLAMEQVDTHFAPALVRSQAHQTCLLIEGSAGIVPAGHTAVSAAHEVGRGQIKLLANQVIAEGIGHPLINLVAHLIGEAAGQIGGGGGGVAGGIEETIQEAPFLGHPSSRLEIQGFRQHRVAEAVHRAGKFS